MNRIPLYRRREPWTTALVAALGLVVIAALVAWMWRPSKNLAAVPAPLPDTAPVATAPASAPESPTQARRQLAASGRWSRLSARDQAILTPLREDWSELSFDQRLKWLDLSLRFPSMSSDEQQRVQERMGQWARMSPTERGAARLNFQEIRQLPPKERLEQWEAYQGLNPAERKVLAVRGQSATQNPAAPGRSDNSAAPVPKSSGAVAETLAGATNVARPVGGTLVQAPIGATTTLVTRVPMTAPAAATGPKIAAQPDQVDPATLLPHTRTNRPAAPASPSAPEAAPAAPEPATTTDPAASPDAAGGAGSPQTTNPPTPNPATAAPRAAAPA